MILLLADVSGYTRYMMENRTAALHSQGIITDLLEAVILQVEIPLEVSKLEGDAVFMFAERRETVDWDLICKRLGSRLKAFVDAFDAKLAELATTLVCPCAACRNLDKLRLKVVAHGGRAVRHHVGRFEELTGVDVILVHRLLKNQVQGNSYILLTEHAFRSLQPPEPDAYTVTALEDKDLGVLSLRVRLLDAAQAPTAPAGTAARTRTMLLELHWWWRAWRSRRT
jgi:hypothetical protein